ncbi:hypothetical protein E2P81_ATG03842 [Venturia nashicola]|uniref:Uncharacterized protein n=1 Tax=Venturia nashicola TaxID=86259 RepID=A0A4Z1PA46_9PEZI|nr:hypothetical protein E6O75_ATG03936 [Venturia nashicola]TLD38167.1 hypothetical protein E2P81_ATG03842 [Venturia nashicola]
MSDNHEIFCNILAHAKSQIYIDQRMTDQDEAVVSFLSWNPLLNLLLNLLLKHRDKTSARGVIRASKSSQYRIKTAGSMNRGSNSRLPRINSLNEPMPTQRHFGASRISQSDGHQSLRIPHQDSWRDEYSLNLASSEQEQLVSTADYSTTSPDLHPVPIKPGYRFPALPSHPQTSRNLLDNVIPSQ